METTTNCEHKYKVTQPKLRPLSELRDLMFTGSMLYSETACADCGELLISDGLDDSIEVGDGNA